MDSELAQIFQQAKPAAFVDAPAPLIIPEKPPTHIASKRQRAAAVLAEPSAEGASAKAHEPDSPERLARTLFVGNVPVAVAKDKRLQRTARRMFEAHGEVESVRFRSLVGEKATSKRVAFITGKTLEERVACNAFVVMKEASGAARAAEALNGALLEGRHLRVDTAANANAKPASKKSVFIGNLPLNVDEENIWKVFESCGPIAYVRVIRDRENGLGKGFGYVAFKDKAAIELALQLAGTPCEGQPLRVSRCAKPGYQQVKMARKEKWAASKESARATKQGPASQDGAKGAKSRLGAAKTMTATATTTTTGEPSKSKFETAKESYLAARMPKLVARSREETREKETAKDDAPRKLHPAEIRKRRKIGKGGVAESAPEPKRQRPTGASAEQKPRAGRAEKAVRAFKPAAKPAAKSDAKKPAHAFKPDANKPTRAFKPAVKSDAKKSTPASKSAAKSDAKKPSFSKPGSGARTHKNNNNRASAK